MESMSENQVWHLVDFPDGVTPIWLQMGFQSENRQGLKYSSLQSKNSCKRVQASSWY